jgi:hypothetical protein
MVTHTISSVSRRHLPSMPQKHPRPILPEWKTAPAILQRLMQLSVIPQPMLDSSYSPSPPGGRTFMCLPQPVRMKIYEHLLSSNEAIVRPWPSEKFTMQLLQVSKDIFVETAFCFYGKVSWPERSVVLVYRSLTRANSAFPQRTGQRRPQPRRRDRSLRYVHKRHRNHHADHPSLPHQYLRAHARLCHGPSLYVPDPTSFHQPTHPGTRVIDRPSNIHQAVLLRLTRNSSPASQYPPAFLTPAHLHPTSNPPTPTSPP